MNQDEQIKIISDLVSEIRTTLLETGMKPAGIAFTKARLERATDEKLNYAYAWLLGFRGVYIKDYKEVLKLIPDYVWKNYKLLDMKKGIYELDKRRESIKLMHDAWRKRPNVLTRTKEEPDAKPQKRKKKGTGAAGH